MLSVHRLSVETVSPTEITTDVIRKKSYPQESIVSDIVVKRFSEEFRALFFLKRMIPLRITLKSGRTLSVSFYIERDGTITKLNTRK